MSGTLRTKVGENAAPATGFRPQSNVPESTVQEAIQYVGTQIAATAANVAALQATIDTAFAATDGQTNLTGGWTFINQRVDGGTLRAEGLPPATHMEFDPAATGSSPEREILVKSGATPQFTCKTGDNYAPALHPNGISWIRDISAAKASWTAVTTEFDKGRIFHDFDFKWPFHPQVRSILVIPMVGQSYMAGTSAYKIVNRDSPFVGTQVRSVINTAAVHPGRMAMFNGTQGVTPRVMGDHDYTKRDMLASVDMELHSLVDLREGPTGTLGETSASQFAKYILPHLDDDEGIIFVNTAIASATLAELSDDEAPWFNTMQALERINIMCKVMGVSCEIGAVLFEQGRADSSGTATSYTTVYNDYTSALTTYYTDWQTAGSKFFGQANTPFIIFQNCATTANLAVADAQLAFALAQSNAYLCVGESYLNNAGNESGPADTGHPGAESQALKGAYLARAYKFIKAGSGYTPLYISGGSRAGADVTMTFNGGSFPSNITLPVQLNTALVSDPGDYGLRYRLGDGASGDYATVTIDTVSISSNQAVFSVTGTPAGSEFVEAGHVGTSVLSPTTSPRVAISDSSTETVTIDGTTYTMHEYCAIGSASVT